MLTTNSKEYFNKVWSFRDHGKSRELILKIKNLLLVGCMIILSNFRMTEMQSFLEGFS